MQQYPTPGSRLFVVVSILTRPGGRVQRNAFRLFLLSSIVSILTRPGGRVQLPPKTAPSLAAGMFQSSPVPEDGCNSTASGKTPALSVSLLTRPGGRVQHMATMWRGSNDKVSILTRPGGRVQPGLPPKTTPPSGVSILTRPGGRVQLLEWPGAADALRSFNPHPSRRTGATGIATTSCPVALVFQSSPVPEDGCNRVTGMRLGYGACFNPHPSRRTGATKMRG